MSLPAAVASFAAHFAELVVVRVEEEIPTGEVAALLKHFHLFYDREADVVRGAGAG